jgi:hypothetical protein
MKQMAVCEKCGSELNENGVCPQCSKKETTEASAPSMSEVPLTETAEPVATQKTGKATASLVLGILSIVFSVLTYIGIILGIIGIVMGFLGLKSPKRKVATWGLGLSILGTIVSIILLIVGAVEVHTGGLPR